MDKKKDILSNTKYDGPVSKESAKAKYEKISTEVKDEPKEKFEEIVEAKIRKAMTEGRFDNLQGKGKPIDLNKYYDMPEHLRLAYLVIKNSGYIPEEIRLKKEIEVLKLKIKNCNSREKKKCLLKELAEITEQYNFHMEYNKSF